ncbi:MAG: Holliday junction resolvase RuvX [Gammaproteobacteria bacterium]|nr:Holliday junction resolvase RuvX [Gammaproteobacteria bacterium]
MSYQSAAQTETFLAFDFGLKKIGIAVGDSECRIANALTRIASVPKQTRWTAIQNLITEWQPTLLVVGISRNIDGSDHELTHAIRRFSRQLEGRFGLPVNLVDETLSSRGAWELISGNPHVSHQKALNKQDQVAAQLILQTWFDQISTEKR